MHVFVNVQQDADTGQSNAEREQDKGEAMARFGGSKGDDEREDVGGGERRHGVQLGGDGGIVVTLDNGGEEIGEAVAGDVATFF